MPSPLIEVRDLHLTYRLHRRRVETIKALIFNSLLGRNRGEVHIFEAIRGISFDVARGEVLGVCGHNGSGKSTLLRVLSGAQHPTRGSVVVRGRVGSLLSLAGGFLPESTGRENIHLNALLMGMEPASIAAQMDSIIDFAELGEFIDSPVRTYSAGMVSRLGFAIGAHVPSDLMLVDESLSVGDARFQSKCEAWLRGRLAQGLSMVVVSHSIETLESMCQRVLWLDHGLIKGCGPAREVLAEYRERFIAAKASAREGANA